MVSNIPGKTAVRPSAFGITKFRPCIVLKRTLRYVVPLIVSMTSLHAKATGTLLMVGDNWCPYNCQADGKLRGYMVEILEHILGKNYVLEYRLEPWTRAVQMVETGQAQILVATPASTDYKIRSSVPLGIDRTCFFVRTNSPWQYKILSDLNGLRIGVIQDYSYDDKGPLDKLIAHYRHSKNGLLEVAYGENALASNFRKLAGERMDVVIENDNVGSYMARELGLKQSIRLAGCNAKHLATTHVAVTAGMKDGPAILNAISTGITSLRQSGVLQQILDRYGISDWYPVLCSKSSDRANAKPGDCKTLKPAR